MNSCNGWLWLTLWNSVHNANLYDACLRASVCLSACLYSCLSAHAFVCLDEWHSLFFFLFCCVFFILISLMLTLIIVLPSIHFPSHLRMLHQWMDMSKSNSASYSGYRPIHSEISRRTNELAWYLSTVYDISCLDRFPGRLMLFYFCKSATEITQRL